METGAKNFDYYEPRCGHGSLTEPRHEWGWSLRGWARSGNGAALSQTAAIDLAYPCGDRRRRTSRPQADLDDAVLGFAGLSLRSDGVALDPQLPANWREAFRFGLHGAAAASGSTSFKADNLSKQRWKRESR